MKTFPVIFLTFVLLGGIEIVQGQTAAGGGQTAGTQQLPSPTPYAVTSRDADSSVWQRETYEQDSNGQIIPRLHSYTELASGLNYLSNGQWTASKEEIDVLPQGGASATQGQHQAYFPGDIYQGEIEDVTPDGVQLQSRPLGLGYFDGTNTVLIAELTNSVGVQTSPNQVLYPNAFVGVDADLQYTYTKAGFEQDIILRAQPPVPETFGLVSQNTRLQVMTEFFNAPQAKVTAALAGSLPDENLDFGVTKMVPGKAFLMGTNSPVVPVGKQWVQIQGRQFLIEEIPIAGVAAALDSLPVPTALNRQTTLPVASGQLVLPPQHLAKNVPAARPMQLAKASLPAHGLVLDYVTLNSSTNINYTFRGDTTYYISGSFYSFSSTVTFTIEGGAVIKYGSSGQITAYYGLLTSTAGPYRMAVLTSMNDNSVGETISGSTGHPTTSSATYLNLQLSTTPATLAYLRFAYAGTGLSQTMSSSSINVNPVWDCQFVHCTTAISDASYHQSTVAGQALYNVLFANDNAAVLDGEYSYPNAGYIYIVGQNVTMDKVVFMLETGSGNGYAYYNSSHLTNSILTGVTDEIYFEDTYGTNSMGLTDCDTAGSGSGIYQTNSAGYYYLTNSSLRDCGLTNIDPALLAQLRQKTTWPPLMLTNQTISYNTNLIPQAARDTNSAVDLGYHYDPIDYIADLCAITNATLTLTKGVAIASYNEAGIELQDSSAIVSIGSPLYPNWLVRYSSVQEEALSLGGTNNYNGMDVYPSYTSTKPNGTYQFTKFASPAGGGFHLYDYGTNSCSALTVQECEFWSGTNTLGGTNSTTLLLDNNLFARSSIGAVGTGSLSFSNNLVWGTASAQLNPASGTVWYAYDNDFDSTTITNSTLTNGYNAYLHCTGYLSPTNSTDIFSTNALAYQTSWLGTFYQPSSSLLIDKGSTTADQVGLYHYTTQTNQVPETNSIVDIGYHYVATDAYGNPLDTYVSGIPDYLVDSAGNGMDTNGLAYWWEEYYFGQVALDTNSDPDGDGNTLLYDYLNGIDPNQNLAFTVLLGVNRHFNTTNATGSYLVLNAVPGHEAVLINDTNFDDAVWTNYDSIVHLALGPTDGVYQVWMGLKGFAPDSTPAWIGTTVYLDRVAPNVVITSPTNTTVTVTTPTIQVQGQADESLESLTYDESNALAVVTNQDGMLLGGQFFDTNILEYTTNYFQCYDIDLTNGLNLITVHATDLAGNVTTTNIAVTLDYSGATNPALTIYWPSTNTAVVGTNFTWRGWVDDPTASVQAQIVDTNGDTNILAGEVERDGKVWIEDVPLTGGTNWLTLWVTNSAGYGIETNLPIMQSALNLTISPVSDDLWLPTVTVSGTFDDFADYTVWVNGVEATNTGGTNWTAYAVPLPAGGTASIQARAISNTDNGGNGTGGNGGGPVSYDNLGNPDPGTNNDAAIDPDRPAEIVVGSGNWTDNWIDNPGDWQNDTWGFTNGVGGTLHDNWWYGSEGATDDDTYGADQSVLYSIAVCHPLYGSDYDESPYPILLVMPYEEGDLQWGTASVGGHKIANVTMTLHTGGKGQSHRQNLFQFTPTATEELSTPPFYRTISLTSIVVAKKTVGADGNLWLAYPDNASPDVTPQLTQSVPYYDFTEPTPQKYKLTIVVNGSNPLWPDHVPNYNNYCVGQQMTFAMSWSPSWPPLPIVNMAGQWSLPQKFVNQPTNYSPTCPTYVENDTLLQNTNQTSCWFVNGTGGKVVVGMSLLMENGQSASIAADGKFTVYRPEKIAENMSQDFLNTTVNIPTPSLYATNISGWLTLGDTSGGYARFWAEYKSSYPGEFREAQIFQSYRKAGNDDAVDSGSQWWNDHAHDKIKDAGLSDSTVSSGGGIAFAMQTDKFPGWPIKAPQTVVNDVFKTYLQFNPDPTGDGIWVTMGRVNWSWADTATLANIPAATVSNPQYHDDDSFPLWDGEIPSSPYGPPPY